MSKYQNYDYNVYGDSDSTLCLTAYPILRYHEDGREYALCEYSEHSAHTLRLRFPKDLKAMEYLLEDLYINNYPLEDYDDWIGMPDELPSDMPEVIREFLEGLPLNEAKEEANA